MLWHPSTLTQSQIVVQEVVSGSAAGAYGKGSEHACGHQGRNHPMNNSDNLHPKDLTIDIEGAGLCATRPPLMYFFGPQISFIRPLCSRSKNSRVASVKRGRSLCEAGTFGVEVWSPPCHYVFGGCVSSLTLWSLLEASYHLSRQLFLEWILVKRLP